jgi:hypothetical protein
MAWVKGQGPKSDKKELADGVDRQTAWLARGRSASGAFGLSASKNLRSA